MGQEVLADRTVPRLREILSRYSDGGGEDIVVSDRAALAARYGVPSPSSVR